MGGVDKQALRLSGEAMGPRGARLLSTAFGEVIVVTERPELYAGGGIRCVRDIIPGRGPLGGIHAALEASDSEWVYIMACDMPRFSPEYAAFIRRRIEAALAEVRAPLAALTRFGRHVEPFHAYYSRALIPSIEGLLGPSLSGSREPSIRDLLEGLQCVWISESEARVFSADWGLFANVNRPPDLEGIAPGPIGSA